MKLQDMMYQAVKVEQQLQKMCVEDYIISSDQELTYLDWTLAASFSRNRLPCLISLYINGQTVGLVILNITFDDDA